MKEYLSNNYDINDSELISIIDDLPLWSAPFGMKLLDTVKLKKNIKALDIGSGFGFPLIELSQRLGNTSKVYGIEPWEEAVDRIKTKKEKLEIENAEIILTTAEKIPFEDNYFDLIVSNNGTNNVQNEKQVFSEISRVSKPGAQLVITLNLPETMIEFYNVYREILSEENLTDEIEKLNNHINSKRKPQKYTEEIITNAGFKINEIIKDSFQLKYLDGTTMLNHFLIKFAFSESWINILNEKDKNRIFDKVETKLNEIAEKYSELILTIPFICVDAYKI